mgnify:CR=1 FL=1
MKMKLIHTLVFIVAALGVYAQGDNYVADDDDYVLDKDSLKAKDKISYNFTMGAGFGYSSNAGDFFSTYYRPSISYAVFPRFTVAGGFEYRNSMVNEYPVFMDYNYQLFSGNISQYYTYVEGAYKVNDRLTVGGSLFYDFTNYQNEFGQEFSNQNDLSNLGYSGFLRYKVRDGLYFEAEVRVNDKSPMRNNFFGAGEYSFFGR